MKKIKTIRAASGHTLAIFAVERFDHASSTYTHYYVVKNWDEEGVTFFYIAKGHPDAPAQYHVWYRNKKMWSSFGTNFQTAIDGAQRDGWLAAQ